MYQVYWTYDGCPDDAASVPLNTVEECKKFIVRRMERNPKQFEDNPKLGLDILDLTSGRFISYVLPASR